MTQDLTQQFEDGTIALRLVDAVNWVERDGVVTEIQVGAVVYNIPAVHQGDEEIIQAALWHSEMPWPGTAHPKLPELRLVERVAHTRGPATVAVDLLYRLPGEDVNPPGTGAFVVTGGSAVSQVESEVDTMGAQITVQHAGEVQGGTITPLVAFDTLTLESPKQSLNPWYTARNLTNAVNNGPFPYDPYAVPRTWLIENVQFQLLDDHPFPWWYRFRYELRRDPLGFDPQVVYIDPSTGRPPPGLVDGEGFKTVLWHAEHDFGYYFPLPPGNVPG